MEADILELVCCLVMGTNAYYYLAPLGKHPAVSRLWIIRPDKIKRGEIPDSEYILVAKKPTVWRLIQMIWATFRLGRRKEVKAFTSINPFPYGILQLPAAMIFKKPVHFGFVGRDWYGNARGRWGWLLRPFIRRADFITATGPQMRQQMIEYGIEEERIAILPHAINIEDYQINEPENSLYTCIYVGQLIKRKRVDLILQAFARVLEGHTEARLCIVGEGPLSNELQAYTVELGIEKSVDFVGFQPDVQPFVTASKVMVMASVMEGLPFALIEGMCSGLVPVTTSVGTIKDLVVSNENGFLVAQDDSNDMAARINQLLDDPDLYLRLRNNALKLRQTYTFDAATAVWGSWLRRLES